MKAQETIHPRSRVKYELPPELLLQVIESVLPSNNDSTILPASHISTKTLLALTLVSQATYPHASKLLRARCVFLDTSRRLAEFLVCIPRVASIATTSLPRTLLLRDITSVYLAPFDTSLDDQPTATWVRELFYQLRGSLRRLVIQMPFHTIDGSNDHLDVRRILREGFQSLVNLQEFVCLSPGPALMQSWSSLLPNPSQTGDGVDDVWGEWPCLERLALFGVSLDSRPFWRDIAHLQHLDTLVLAEPQRLEGADIKKEYFHQLWQKSDSGVDGGRADATIHNSSGSLDVPKRKRFRVLLVDVPNDTLFQRGILGDTSMWKLYDPDETMLVQLYEVPTAYYGDATATEEVTSWMKRGALQGTMWKWDGRLVGEEG